MAVYTLVKKNELKEFIKSYPIGEVLSFHGIKEGIENSNFLIETTRGRFILTLFEERVDPNDLPFFIELMNCLRGFGVMCPKPIASFKHNILGRLCGRPAIIVTFLEGKAVTKIQPDHCGQLGAALSLLHKAGAKCNLTRDNNLSLAGWVAIAQSIENELDNIKIGLRHELMTEIVYLREKWPNNLPKGIIHGDLFPDNVFFLRGQLSGLIDFYFACTDSFTYDISVCLNSWCFEENGEFNIEKAKCFFEKYQALRPLSKLEVGALPILARGSAMRFLLTRCYDWIHTLDGTLVSRKDPLEYWKKLCFHRTVMSPEEYGLKFGN